MSYLEINGFKNESELISKIDNLENKMDTILLTINSLIKYNSNIEDKINQIWNKINIDNLEKNILDKNNLDRNNLDKNNLDKNNLDRNNSEKYKNIIDDSTILLSRNQINNIVKFDNGIEECKESKLSNYRTLMSNNIKLNKSPARFKNRSTERERPKISNLENKSDNETIKINSDNLDKKKKNIKNIEKYKDVKKENIDLDKTFVKKCLDDRCLESDIKIFKKMYIENVSKEYFPIRSFRKKIQYWLEGHMNDDIDGNYIKDTIIHNIELCYINVNKYENYEDDTEEFIKNQDYISKLNEQKNKDKFLSMIINIIKV